MRKEKKINVIENVEVLSIDIIRVIYKADEKRIIALISARMKDYYVDEFNGKIIELNDDKRFFQEFWGFCLHNDRWVLEYIKQIGEDESLVLANEVD